MISSFSAVAIQVAVLFILITLGFVCSKVKIFDEHTIKHVTRFILYFVTPCVIINSFNRDFDPDMAKKLLIAAGSSFLIHLLSIGLSYACIHDKDRSRKNVLQYGIIFSNCGYMALPLQAAVLGPEGVFLGAAYVAVFNLFTWTFGLFLMSGQVSEIRIKKIVLNPGLLSIIAGVILFISPFKLPQIISSPVQHLANLNTPIPMLVIGFYLSQISSLKVLKDWKLVLGIFLRLVICPLLGLVILYLMGIKGTVLAAMVIAASAPTAANTTMFAGIYDKDTQTAVTMVAISTLFSIVTMPLVVSLALMLN